MDTKAKIQVSDLGKPAAIKDAPEGTKRLVLSTLIGVATGIIERKTPTGDVFRGLKGSFEVTYPDGSGISAPTLYMLPALGGPIIDALSADDAPRSMEFAYEFGAAMKGDAAVFDIAETVKPRTGDPLASLREQTAKPKVAPKK